MVCPKRRRKTRGAALRKFTQVCEGHSRWKAARSRAPKVREASRAVLTRRAFGDRLLGVTVTGSRRLSTEHLPLAPGEAMLHGRASQGQLRVWRVVTSFSLPSWSGRSVTGARLRLHLFSPVARQFRNKLPTRITSSLLGLRGSMRRVLPRHLQTHFNPPFTPGRITISPRAAHLSRKARQLSNAHPTAKQHKPRTSSRGVLRNPSLWQAVQRRTEASGAILATARSNPPPLSPDCDTPYHELGGLPPVNCCSIIRILQVTQLATGQLRSAWLLVSVYRLHLSSCAASKVLLFRSNMSDSRSSLLEAADPLKRANLPRRESRLYKIKGLAR